MTTEIEALEKRIMQRFDRLDDLAKTYREDRDFVLKTLDKWRRGLVVVLALVKRFV